MTTVTFPIGGCNFASCGRDLEKRLARVSGIVQVNASYVSQTATITYDETQLSLTHLQELVRDCGFGCGEPLTMGAARTVAPAAPPPPHGPEQVVSEHEAAMHAHVEQAMQPGHGGMEHGGAMMHDMSEPAMAAAMEADMRRRFWIALVLTIPIVLYSSLGTSVLRLSLPVPFGINRNWLLLVLTTPV